LQALKISSKMTLDQVALQQVPEPRPGPGEVLIRLKAAALNHRDLGMLDWEPDRSFIVGADGAGLIEQRGPGVERPAEGAAVIINPALAWGADQAAFSDAFSILGYPSDGTFAEAVVVPAENVAPKPPHLSFLEAAALPLAGLTAFRAVRSRAQVQAGERVLIHGIGGGVALFALQFAKVAGARVMVTSTVGEKLEQARAMGADHGVNSRTTDWRQAARRWTDEKGLDVVIDSVGGELFAQSLLALRRGGRIVTYGTTAATHARIDVETLFWHQINVLGSTMGSPQDFADMVALVQATNLTPVIDSVWPLSEVRSALQRLAEGRQFGKIVLDIAA
jgi:NADPH:quinone reductase-like Zn-dependent oxidoreductase